MNKSEKLKKLEQRFNIASEIVEEMAKDLIEPDEEEEDLSTELAIRPEMQLPVAIPDNIPEDQVFTVDLLKQDFFTMRQGIKQVIATGQHILAQASVLDLADMKASQLDALTNLQNSLGSNMRLLIELYKQIIEIEKSRAAVHGGNSGQPEEKGSTVVKGNMTQQNIIVGGTHDMLKLLEQLDRKNEVEINGTSNKT